MNATKKKWALASVLVLTVAGMFAAPSYVRLHRERPADEQETRAWRKEAGHRWPGVQLSWRVMFSAHRRPWRRTTESVSAHGPEFNVSNSKGGSLKMTTETSENQRKLLYAGSVRNLDPKRRLNVREAVLEVRRWGFVVASERILLGGKEGLWLGPEETHDFDAESYIPAGLIEKTEDVDELSAKLGFRWEEER